MTDSLLDYFTSSCLRFNYMQQSSSVSYRVKLSRREPFIISCVHILKQQRNLYIVYIAFEKSMTTCISTRAPESTYLTRCINMERIGCTCVTYVHVHKAHGQPWVWSVGVVNTKHHICGDPGPCQFEAKFLPHLTAWLYLQFTQMPTSRDTCMAIFVPTIMTDRQTNYFTPCAYTRSNYCGNYHHADIAHSLID